MKESEHYQENTVTGFTIDVTINGQPDDGLAFESVNNDGTHGLFHLAIANVAKHVKPNSDHYKTAQQRVKSTYSRRTGKVVVSMLPTHLVEKLSLKEGKTRDAIITTWEAKRDSDGTWEVVDSYIWEGQFRSLKSFDFRDGKHFLKRGRIAHKGTMHFQDAHTLATQAQPLCEFFLGEDPATVTNVAKRLVDQSNAYSNKKCSEATGEKQLFRNHAGVTCNVTPDGKFQLRSTYHQIEPERPIPLFIHDICARYSTECKGHYHHQAESYGYFSSPLRDFGALVNQQLLRIRLYGRKPRYFTKERLKSIAKLCNESARTKNKLTTEKAIEQLRTELDSKSFNLTDCPKVKFSFYLGIYANLPEQQRDSPFAAEIAERIDTRIAANKLRSIDYCILLFLHETWPKLTQIALNGIKQNNCQEDICEFLSQYLDRNQRLEKLTIEQHGDGTYTGMICLSTKHGITETVRTEPTSSQRDVSQETIALLMERIRTAA